MTMRARCPRRLPSPGSSRRRGLGCDRSALAALEFALMAPLLSTLFIGSVDAAQVFMSQLRLTSAVYAGANYAIVNGASVTSAAGATLASSIATIVGNVNGAGWASGTVVVNNCPPVTFPGGAPSGTCANADSFYCLTGSPGTWNWGPAQTSNTAACGANQLTAGKFVTITANYIVAPIILGLGFGDGTISQSVVVQVQ